MFRFIVKNRKILICGLFTEIAANPDQIKDYQSLRGLQVDDAWERVKLIFLRNAYDELHPEMINTIQIAQIGMLSGAVIGGTVGSKKAVEDFLRNNDTTAFFTEKDAYRKLSRVSFLGFGKGSLKLGAYFCVFFGGFYLFSACWEAYRNKSGIIEYSLGGTGIGALCRFNYGIRGMISGGIIGGALGTIYGIIYVGVQKLFGIHSDEFKYAQYAFSKYQNSLKLKSNTAILEVKPPEASHLLWHTEDPLNSLTDDEITEKKEAQIKKDVKSK